MDAIIPYLSFNGNAADALAFYAKAFDGKIVFQQSFGESPMGGNTPADHKDKVMHARFEAGGLTLMVSDNMPGHVVTNGSNTNLSLNFSTVQDIDKTFASLSEGANIIMPLQDTFWGAKFGMLTDKFGINWMFNHDYPKDVK